MPCLRLIIKIIRKGATKFKFFIAIALTMGSVSSFAEVPLKVQKVATSVYALIGETDQRSVENHVNNATFGLIVTPKGSIPIDSGGTYLGAKQIDETITNITDQPVKIVINTGGQDHRWWGNGYFKKKGAHIITSEVALKDQKKRTDDQYMSLDRFLGKAMEGTEAVYADETFKDDKELKFGGETFKLIYIGPAHTKGDFFVWMPEKKVMFAGDIVFTDRMLGPGPAKNTASWLNVFEKMVAYKPEIIVPGHGSPATIEKATKDTYDYISYMRKEVSKVIDKGGDMQDALKIDQSGFRYLKVFDKMAGRSAQAFFEQMEFE